MKLPQSMAVQRFRKKAGALFSWAKTPRSRGNIRAITLDTTAILGVAVTTIGIEKIYEPAAWIFVGVLLCALSLVLGSKVNK